MRWTDDLKKQAGNLCTRKARNREDACRSVGVKIEAKVVENEP